MREKILIVDDEKDTREFMARALSGKYDVLTAADAELAMKLLTDDKSIRLMLSDIRMPGEDGAVDNYVDGFKALQQIGYEKYVSFECGCGGDRATLVTNAVNLLRAQWEEAKGC